MRRTYRPLGDYEIQHNAEVGLFTRLSKIGVFISNAVADACPDVIPDGFRFDMDDLAPITEILFHDVGIVLQV